MSAFDDIDARFRTPKKAEIQLDPYQPGQDCPKPRCRGKLVWCSLTDQIDAGGISLRCDDPGCGWREAGEAADG